MTDHEIVVGTTVRLGDIPGPMMRVIGIEPDKRIRCFWFNRKNEPEATVFRREMLIRCAPFVPRTHPDSVTEQFETMEHADVAD